MQLIAATLVLESGETFAGFSPDWQAGAAFGEVVFTTGMTGYVESLTDPSYAGQILSFTFPLIGNYGVPGKETWESHKIHAAGVITADASRWASHWDSACSFLDWLKSQKVPLITGVDTRELTKTLRKKGAAAGAICIDPARPSRFPDANTRHLVKETSVRQRSIHGSGQKTLIAVDCGMKENIIRHLEKFPVKIARVPFDEDYSDEPFDAVFISNGPGDPAMCKETIAVLRKVLAKGKPIFGICLGAQLLALAAGASTYKLKFGHRGQNVPCKNLGEDRCILTSQNHGYAIDPNTLPKGWKATFINLNDGSIEGIAHESLPYSAVQFHPESNPGPTDAAYLFETFFAQMSRA